MSVERELAQTLFRRVMDRFGDRLTPSQAQEVQEAVEAIARDLVALRSVPLGNGDGPAVGPASEGARG